MMISQSPPPSLSPVCWCRRKVRRRAPLLDAQARRLDLRLGIGLLRCSGAARPAPARRLGRAHRAVAVVAQQQVARQRGLPHQLAIARAHRDAGVAKGIQRVARLPGAFLARLARALQMHVHAGQHFLGLDRLGDVVHPAASSAATR
jgi:hypothetical protein